MESFPCPLTDPGYLPPQIPSWIHYPPRHPTTHHPTPYPNRRERAMGPEISYPLGKDMGTRDTLLPPKKDLIPEITYSPWTTNTCEIIPFPQLRWWVKNENLVRYRIIPVKCHPSINQSVKIVIDKLLNKIAFQYDAYRPRVDRISQHALCRGGCLLRGVSAFGGCLLLGAVSALGGVCSWGRCLLPGGMVAAPRGVSAPRGDGGCSQGACLLPGGFLLGGVLYPSMHWGGHPPLCEQNHTRLWKHNLAPTSLRAVIIKRTKLYDISSKHDEKTIK